MSYYTVTKQRKSTRLLKKNNPVFYKNYFEDSESDLELTDGDSDYDSNNDIMYTEALYTNENQSDSDTYHVEKNTNDFIDMKNKVYIFLVCIFLFTSYLIIFNYHLQLYLKEIKTN